MIYVFDLDGTLCETEGRNYAEAKPVTSRIDAVNRLYAEGHTIIVDTARGSVTGEDWWRRTFAQLVRWGLHFHELRTGKKFYANYYIDDSGVHADEFFACES